MFPACEVVSFSVFVQLRRAALCRRHPAGTRGELWHVRHHSTTSALTRLNQEGVN